MPTFSHRRFFIGVVLLVVFAGNVHGQQRAAETPEQLLKRISESIRTRDVERLMSCLSGQNSNQEKAAATATAKAILLHTDVKKFRAAGKVKYGDQFRQVIGLQAYFITVSIGSMDIEPFLNESKIEVDDEANTALATYGKGVGKRTLNLVRENGRWFLKTQLSRQPDGTPIPELRYQASAHFIRDCLEALEESNNQKEFRQRVEKASKTYQTAVGTFK